MKGAILSFFLFCLLPAFFASSASGQSTDHSFDSITIALKWQHQFQFAGYYAAIEQGFFAEEGLQVTLTTPNNFRFPFETVAAGEAEYGVFASEVLLSRVEGNPFVVVASIFQHSPLVLASRADNNYIYPSSFVGKRVNSPGSAQMVLAALFQREGINPDDIFFVREEWDLSALADGRIDGMSGYITDLPYQFENMGVPIRLLRPIDYGIDFYGDLLFTTETEINKNPHRVAAVKRAVLRGWEYALENSDELVDHILTLPGVQERGFTRELLKYEAEKTRELIQPVLVELGHINPGRWEKIAAMYADQGLMPRDYSLEGFIYAPAQSNATAQKILRIAGTLIAFSLLVVFGIFITSRRKLVRMQRKHQRKESLFQAISKNFDSGFVYQLDTGKGGEIREFLFISDGVTAITGYTPQQITTDPALMYAATNADDKRTLFEKESESIAQRKALRAVVRIHHLNGSVSWCQITSIPRREANGHMIWEGMVLDITEQRKSEEFSKRVFESSKVPIVIMDAESFNYLDCNQAAVDIYKFKSKEEVIGKTPFDVSAPLQYDGTSSDAKAFYYLNKALKKGSAVFEWRHQRPDGELWDAEVHLLAFSVEGKTILQFSLLDITERKRAVEALQEREQRAVAQRNVIADLALDQLLAERDTTITLRQIVKELSTTLNVARASVWTMSEDSAQLQCLSQYEADKGVYTSGAVLKSHDIPGYFDALMRQNRISAIDAQNDPRTRELTEQHLKPLGITSILDAGIYLQGNMAGVVCAEHIGPKRKWYPDEESFISSIAAIVAQLILNTKRKQAEDQLRKLSQAVEQSPAAVVITDINANIEYVNSKFTDVTGYSTAEVIGKNPRILQSGEMDESIFRQLWSHLLAGEEWQGEFLNKHKDGHLFWERARISPLRDDQGKTTHFIAVKEDITVQKRYEQQLEYQASHDALTGLANRILLMDRLEQAIRFAHRSQRMVAVLLLDLDRFKVINDTLGHRSGDILLCQIAERLKAVVRDTDTVARLGGDEFIVLLTEVPNERDMFRLVQNISEIFLQPYLIGQRQLMLAASIGVCCYPQHSDDPETLIRYADIAMYQSKNSGGAFACYEGCMDRFHPDTLDLETGLHGALERREFCLHYQPKVDLAAGTIDGCEALLRWHHPTMGMVSPGQFIPLAEETGLIVPIGSWVIEEACRQSIAWQLAGLPPIRVAVNLSARQFRQGDLAETINSILSESGLAPSLLELELTESMIMDDPQGAEQALIALKKLGVSLSLDDFGTGYSSLNYLSRFPVDHLKIDQSFIRDIGTSDNRTAVISSIIDIAHNLHLTAIAEGVETREQLQFLMTHGCEAMQGYLFSKPLSAVEFAGLLQQGTCLNDIVTGLSADK